MKTFFMLIGLSILISVGCSSKPSEHPAKPHIPEFLRLDLMVQNDSEIMLTLTNISKRTIDVYSHVETYERHYDYFSLECETMDGKKFELNFLANRDKSAPVIVKLAPGESFSHIIDIEKWSKRDINTASLQAAGLTALPDELKIKAFYNVEPCTNCNDYYQSVWSGIVSSETTEYRNTHGNYHYSISVSQIVKGTHKHKEYILTPWSVRLINYPLSSEPISTLFYKSLSKVEADDIESFMKAFPLNELDKAYVNDGVEGEQHFEFVLQYGSLERTITDSYFFQKDLKKVVNKINACIPEEYAIYFE